MKLKYIIFIFIFGLFIGCDNSVIQEPCEINNTASLILTNVTGHTTSVEIVIKDENGITTEYIYGPKTIDTEISVYIDIPVRTRLIVIYKYDTNSNYGIMTTPIWLAPFSACDEIRRDLLP